MYYYANTHMNNFKFTKETTALFKAVLSLTSVKETEAFFRDLCTPKEINDMSERWQIVQKLQAGKSYREIATTLNTSTTTVTRVAQWLTNGAGGYQSVLQKNAHHGSSRSGKA